MSLSGYPLTVHPALRMRHSQPLGEWRTDLRLLRVFHASLFGVLIHFKGIGRLCSPARSLASWDPCPVLCQLNLMFDCAIPSALAVAFRYSTESFPLLLRRVNSRLVPGTPSENTSILSISHPDQPSELLGSRGKISKGCWDKPFLCILRWNIYSLFVSLREYYVRSITNKLCQAEKLGCSQTVILV